MPVLAPVDLLLAQFEPTRDDAPMEQGAGGRGRVDYGNERWEGGIGQSQRSVMKKKRGILLFSALLIVLAAAWWGFGRREKPITVRGNISAQDITEIKDVVRRDLRQDILPEFSLAAIKAMPANLKTYLRYQILEIDADTNGGHATVSVWLTPPRTNVEFDRAIYFMGKESGRWRTE